MGVAAYDKKGLIRLAVETIEHIIEGISSGGMQIRWRSFRQRCLEKQILIRKH